MEKEEVINELPEGTGAGTVYDGEIIKLDEVLDKNVIVYDFMTRPSQFSEGDYAIMQLGVDGEKRICMTGSQVITNNLKSNSDLMPYRCRFSEMVSPKSHRKYYIITQAITS